MAKQISKTRNKFLGDPVKKKSLILMLIFVIFSVTFFFELAVCPYSSRSVSTILTTPVAYPLRHSYQRRVWYDSRGTGRIWAFVQDNGIHNAMEIYTSTDGSTWSWAARSNIWFYSSSWFNGTHGFMCDSYRADDVSFQLATCYENGTVTFGSLRGIGIGGSQEWWNSITVDTSGYAWIAFVNSTGGNNEVWVMKAQDKNGTTWGDYTPISTYTTAGNFYPVIVPLSNDQLYCSYKDSTGNLTGRLYNGTAWQNEELIIQDSGSFAADYSVIADSNDLIHIAYGNETSDNYYHIIRNGSWGSPQLVATGGIGYRADPQLTVDGIDLFYSYVVHAETSIYFLQYFGANQSYSNPTLLCTYTDGMRYNTIHAMYSSGSDDHKVGVLWSDNGGVSPYTIYYCEIYTLPPQTAQQIISLNLELAAGIMISLFILVFLMHMIYMIDSGKSQQFIQLLFGYVISAIILCALALIMLTI